MIFAAGKQGRDGATQPLARRQLPKYLSFVLLALRPATLPLGLTIAAARGFYRRLRPEAPPAPLPPTEVEVFIGRMEAMAARSRTMGYLLQVCISRLDQMIWPKKRIHPLAQPRTMPAAGLRIVRARRHKPWLTSRRAIPPVVALSLVAPAIAGVILYLSAGVYGGYVNNVVPPEELAINQPLRGARIYDRNGRLLYEYVDDKEGIRLPVPLTDVADVFLAATIATEDSSFFTNPGVNPRGLLRASWENFSPFLEPPLLEEKDALEGSGGSSITQQLVKNVYIPPEERTERSLDRKLREAFYALELTQRYEKSQILEWYVNQISYGGLFNGVEAASRGYFGKPAAELTLGEAALLAGIPQSPAKYSPVTDMETALVRRGEILDLIARQGQIQIGAERFYTPSAEEIAAARAETPALVTQDHLIEAPHFVLTTLLPSWRPCSGAMRCTATA
ncbi:MAG: hypothetical protein GEU75_08375 [Dehalococcoidia bacterium]|nr:hypothetical protein [Dehalococcoidia bacterium]